MSRGEKQQLEYLEAAKERIEEAIKGHKIGMRDPALADADTASAHLDAYRKGPRQMADDLDGESDE